MPKNNTRQETLLKEWRAYNKRMKATGCTMTLEEYSKWVNGKTSKRIKACESVPTYAYPSWAVSNDHIKSVKEKGTRIAGRNTMIERVRQGDIVGDEAVEIIRKSNRVGLLTSKGAYGYMGDDFDPKQLGKKTQQLE